MPTSFAPMLVIKDGHGAIAFYEKAYNATLKRCYNNDDGTVHVAELSINNAVFHIRQVDIDRGHFDPLVHKGITSLVELWVEDPGTVFASALKAGAKELSAVKDYLEVGYTQGTLVDPFGHHWHIMKPIAKKV